MYTSLQYWCPVAAASMTRNLSQIVLEFGLYTKRVCTNTAFCTIMVQKSKKIGSAMKKASALAGLMGVR
jgi:hypothetical protein